ncbi:MAG: DUF1924 domain-containing protein [Candidatus Accumulibacter phosphatis]|uniref:DUF1924 domain-containing protein n=2 Tax=Candidatus Accumulibacter TaxID=327159 RepID=A0A080M1K9_9PROT|nr:MULTISPECIES: DUF1924 domain-containing protein [Candidatus Accumulibacter]KFB75162.1 MAG: hypothetical protein AW06_003817 [Candidatus Accumulibacter cognatus]MBN8516685.1 DUF1924 domain-containing protein [Accumulibacter sp.]MBO3713200.1 DUF1924 domain-containing protein [Accumulibacter sp.]MCC2868977.1 DUF1924 domain-containing protein [Candidatus Accumulibacter phosphatis]MCQ1549313.1 DUF1924 domain-containing protein [Candidatus Accumulibacter phosphatis]
MNSPQASLLAQVIRLALAAIPAGAAARDELLAGDALKAEKNDPAFAGFSAALGEIFHRKSCAGDKPGTPACTSRHLEDLHAAIRTPAGKAIDTVAVSVSPTRLVDPA